MLVHAIDDRMLHSVPFIALAICKVFWNLTVFMSHAWCHGRCPALVLPRGQGHFPMMDAGGSPFPHNEGASVDGGISIAAGTTGSVLEPVKTEVLKI